MFDKLPFNPSFQRKTICWSWRSISDRISNLFFPFFPLSPRRLFICKLFKHRTWPGQPSLSSLNEPAQCLPHTKHFGWEKCFPLSTARANQRWKCKTGLQTPLSGNGEKAPIFSSHQQRAKTTKRKEKGTDRKRHHSTGEGSNRLKFN